MLKKLATFMAAAVTAMLLLAAPASASDVRIGWAFLFPIPLPIPIYQVPHERTPVAVGLLFPIPIPLPVYDYGYHRAAAERRERVEEYGQLQTIVSPQEASVYIDGKYYGKAGDFYTAGEAATVYPGTLNVAFKAPGYKDYALEVHVSPGEIVSVQYDLQPIQTAPR